MVIFRKLYALNERGLKNIELWAITEEKIKISNKVILYNPFIKKVMKFPVFIQKLQNLNL